MDQGSSSNIGGLLTALVAGFSFTACVPATILAYPKRTYEQGTLGAHVNEHFRNHVIGCNLIPPVDVRTWRKDFEELDLIPGSFSSKYVGILQTKVHEYKVAGNTLWLYPFTAEEVTPNALPDFAPNPNRLLREDGSPVELVADNQGPIPQAVPGFNEFGHRESCSLYITSQLNAGVAVPSSSVEAGLKKEVDQHSNLVMVRAYFRSPLYDAFQSNATEGVYAKMLLREKYLQFPALSGGYYLSQFPGSVLHTSSVAQQTTSFSAQGTAAASAGVSNVSLELGVRYGDRSSDLTREYKTLVEAPAAGRTWTDYFSPLPSAEEIRALFDKAVARSTVEFDKGENRFLRKRVSHRHWRELDGIPQATCNEEWALDVDPKSTADFSSISLTTQWVPGAVATSKQAAILPRCRFTVRVMPNDSLFGSQRPSSVKLVYTVRSSTQTPEKLRLSFGMSEVLPTTNDPQLMHIPRVLFGSQPTTPTTYVATWDAKLFFEDGNNPIDHSTNREHQQSLSKVELKCPEGVRRVMPRLIHEQARQAYTLNLSALDDLPMPVADMSQAVTCTLTGVLTVPIMSSPKIGGTPTAELPLNITLLAPPAPQPQPTALPAPVL